MRLIYVAGPYRDKRGEWYVHQNIEDAKAVARQIWQMRAVALCPHANTAMYGGNDVDDDVWLRGDIEILRRCDAVVTMPRWKESAGAMNEVDQAARLAIPVFEWPDSKAALRRFIEDEPREVEDARNASH